MKSTPTEWIIQPDTIRHKAERRYRDFLASWFHGKTSEFFPMVIHGKKDVAANAEYGELAKQIRLLRTESKEHRSHGYRVVWKQVNSPRFGKNEFPDGIFIDTCDDFLFLIGKKNEFRRLETAVTKVRDHFPELESCLANQLSVLPKLVDDIESLVDVLRFFQENPKPSCFLREIPIKGIDTKFVERPEIGSILRQWLDILLPPWAIRADEIDHFARRYFLRYDEPLIRIRFLDPSLQQKLGCPFSDIAVPIHTFGALDIPDCNMVIVENKISLLTLPPIMNTIAVGGMGYSVTLLKYVPWLNTSNVIYWGDVDSDGFRILSNLRTVFPHATSILMDVDALNIFHELTTKGNTRLLETPPLLNEQETSAFLRCRDENVRLEQERIPISNFLENLSTINK